tara:strand:- start:516 stop:797 length:282 start_codon:yes stop_codon:yes gene_type:complete
VEYFPVKTGLEIIKIMKSIIRVLIINKSILIILILFIDSVSMLLKNLNVLKGIFSNFLLFNKWKIKGIEISGNNQRIAVVRKLIAKCKLLLKL